jgi:hypothetical protein
MYLGVLQGLRTGSPRLTITRARPSGRASMSQRSHAHRLTSTVVGGSRSVPAGRNTGSSSSTGVWPHPAAKGPCPGLSRSPSFRSSGRELLPLERHLCRSSREAPSGLRIAPAGLHGTCGAGERGAPLRGVKGDPTPRTCSNRVCDGPLGQVNNVEPAGALSSLERPSESQPTLPRVALFRRSPPGPRDSTGYPLCSDGGHPGGQRSRERREWRLHY